MSTTMSGQLKYANDRIVSGKVTCALKTSHVPFAEKYKQNPITMADLQRLSTIIEENDLCSKLWLTTGNCGIMAITLRYMLGGKGQLWRFGYSRDETDNNHIVLHLGRGRYIDGRKLWKSKAKLVDYWGREFQKTFNEPMIVDYTCRCFTVEVMEKILSGLLAGQVPDRNQISAYRRESGF